MADKASQIVTDRKWYSISAKGVLEAAKAVGDAGVPLLSACMKVIELLGKAKI